MDNLSAILAQGARQGKDEEFGQMLDEYDLLALIRADTGERGHESGGYVLFHSCPICGHHDCFRYYEATKSWSCFGASNVSGYAGGTIFEYFKATRNADNTEAVKWLREQTGHPYESVAAAKTPQKMESRHIDLNRWKIVDTDLDHLPTLAPELVEGLLRIGRKAIIAGASKSHKSWLALNLALSVATGGEWIGYRCRRGRVLYLNMEIPSDSFPHRIAAVARAKGVDPSDLANLQRIDLRGFYGGAEVLSGIIRSQASKGSYSLIILDPLYKVLGGDENSAYEVGMLCKTIDQICEDVGCAFVYVHHHSKGAKGDVASIDRASGSGVFARDPDAIIDVTRIFPPDDENPLDPGDRAYQLTFDLREFVSPDPVNVLYHDRLHYRDYEGVTEDWKPMSATGRRRGGASTAKLNRLKGDLASAQMLTRLAVGFYSQGVGRDGLLLKDAAALCGCDSRQLVRAVEGSDLFELVQVSQRKRYVKALDPPPPTQPELGD